MDTDRDPWLREIADEIIKFAIEQLEIQQPRDDYRELLELSIIFLGGVPPRGIRFRAPGGLHRARWMAKAIYSLKLWMFRAQFKLTLREETSLKAVCDFVIKVYLKAWFLAPAPHLAPAQDLWLLKELQQYHTIHPKISAAALKKFQGHLWYLNERLIPLALFDDSGSFSLEDKGAMAQEMLQAAEEMIPPKRAVVYTSAIQEKKISSFFSGQSKAFFRILGLDDGFLLKTPEAWESDAAFQRAKEVATHLKVVNDLSERGVALMTEYNRLITADEQQKQYLLQVVTDYRKRFPTPKKSDLV